MQKGVAGASRFNPHQHGLKHPVDENTRQIKKLNHVLHKTSETSDVSSEIILGINMNAIKPRHGAPMIRAQTVAMRFMSQQFLNFDN